MNGTVQQTKGTERLKKIAAIGADKAAAKTGKVEPEKSNSGGQEVELRSNDLSARNRDER